MANSFKCEVSSGVIFLVVFLLVSSLIVSGLPIIRKVVAATWIVDDDGPADFHTIQLAIDSADDGDIIQVRSGTYYEHVIVDKRLSIIGEDSSNTIVEGGGVGSIFTLVADNVSVRGFLIQHGENGVVFRSNYCNVTDVVLMFNEVNVLLDAGCKGNLVARNEILYAVTSGIYGDRCGSNVIAKNNVSFSGWHGIFLYGSDPCVLDGNSFLSNNYGVFIRYTINNTVTENLVSDNNIGIYIYSDEDPIRPSRLSKYNIIEGNVIQNNTLGVKVLHIGTITESAENRFSRNLFLYNDVGLNISGSCGNLIFNNNFINNSKQVAVSQSFDNSWDSGYYVGGNYWSDHNGSDVFWGIQQNETGSDGIVDFPYNVSSNPLEKDNFPFLRENEWLEPPKIRVLSPSNGTYRVETLPLITEMNKPLFVSYSLDNQPNVTVAGKVMLTNLSVGVHNMSVYANDVLGDEFSLKIMFTITFLGDLSLDGTVNIVDIAIVAYSFWQSVGDERWNPEADLNSDQIINILDITMVAKDFGATI